MNPNKVDISSNPSFEIAATKQTCVVVAGYKVIKLRQWFRRSIRRESDRAVFAMLDSRVGLRGK